MLDIRFTGFPTRSDTNWPVQAQKRAGNLKFRIKQEEDFFSICAAKTKVLTNSFDEMTGMKTTIICLALVLAHLSRRLTGELKG